MMEAKFLREQLALVRELAERADPYIKQRLLALADKYERRLAAQSRQTQERSQG
ncbi:hypothetical protein [Bradyrhizobium sp. 195]|uniref:hypothetical protein n=1 Tax=Bradyrhizobium sp. 195 TaxID=2782662 RepID=UPI0020008883|nr:hypothetical protein [Bradyrhizobium sp. 195]UPK23951.1 hypothetical protein IVB26_21390 [Bradyrhizobium sp. 195]